MKRKKIQNSVEIRKLNYVFCFRFRHFISARNGNRKNTEFRGNTETEIPWKPYPKLTYLITSPIFNLLICALYTFEHAQSNTFDFFKIPSGNLRQIRHRSKMN